MKLQELLRGTEPIEILGDVGISVTGLHYDSRRIEPGQVFVAIRGEKTDGNRFISQGLEQGAIAVLSEASPVLAAVSPNAVPDPAPSAPRAPHPPPRAWVRVTDARKALARAAANFYGHPANALELVGVTGTNGKTTTCLLLDAIFAAAGKKSGLFGTIEYRLAGRRLPAPNTTPESLDLQAYLGELRALGATHAALEVSSHALALDRVYGCPFRAAVFTNLTRDHLDFHGTLEAYFAEKRKLFTGWGTAPPAWAILNADDSRSAELLSCGSPNVLTYGLAAGAQVRPHGANPALNSGSFLMETPWGKLESRSRLLGRPNVYNLLAAAATALALGFGVEQVEGGLAALQAVPGRFEQVQSGQPFLVLVDYAHTDDALRNLLTTARELVNQGGRVVTVFGCGGDRDRTKRPLMGQVAGSLSDLVVLTSDNPRSEEPRAIIHDALVGLQQSGARHARHLVEPDRACAIELALREARPGDIVLLAGKGHETYQIIGDRRLPFDDRLIARQVLQRLGYEVGDAGNR